MSVEIIIALTAVVIAIIQTIITIIIGIKALTYSKAQTQIAQAQLEPDKKLKTKKRNWKVYVEIGFNSLIVLNSLFVIINFLLGYMFFSVETWWGRFVIIASCYNLALYSKFLTESLKKPRQIETEV